MSIQLVKDFNVQGRELTVEVGRATELDDGTIFAWSYKILVKGHLIQESVYHWDTTKRPLTNTNVANHLASFWANVPAVVEAQQFPESNELKLDKIVLKCADLMHEYFKPDAEFKDYDIVSKFLDDIEWHVVLRPNYKSTDYLISFYKLQSLAAGLIEVTVYRNTHAFNTVL